jgi:hypothetical protein
MCKNYFLAFFLCLAQRALMALIALALRCLAVIFLALALPPRRPASRVSTAGMVDGADNSINAILRHPGASFQRINLRYPPFTKP